MRAILVAVALAVSVARADPAPAASPRADLVTACVRQDQTRNSALGRRRLDIGAITECLRKANGASPPGEESR